MMRDSEVELERLVARGLEYRERMPLEPSKRRGYIFHLLVGLTVLSVGLNLYFEARGITRTFPRGTFPYPSLGIALFALGKCCVGRRGAGLGAVAIAWLVMLYGAANAGAWAFYLGQVLFWWPPLVLLTFFFPSAERHVWAKSLERLWRRLAAAVRREDPSHLSTRHALSSPPG
jgi:hypothetical protein